MLAAQAAEFSQRGFRAFYELIHGNKMQKHLSDAVDKCFKAARARRGVLFRGFRGCRKTTTFSVDFTAFFIGHFRRRQISSLGHQIPTRDNHQAHRPVN